MDDPAGVRRAASAADALARIAAAEAAFLSRGDESGTHRKERALWPAPPPAGAAAPAWYRETGAGMGATLNVASRTLRGVMGEAEGERVWAAVVGVTPEQARRGGSS